MTYLILTDFIQKVSDTADPGILWKKMIDIGFSNYVIDWFKTYLSNRLFRVNLKNCFSNTVKI